MEISIRTKQKTTFSLFHVALLSLLISPITTVGGNQISKYADEINNPVKSLTLKEHQDYKAGNGMGFAKAAELNRYPGPRHVLDLESELELTRSQKHSTQQIFQAMKQEAIILGNELIEQERVLNALFQSQSIDKSMLIEQLNEISETRSKLRFIHLNAHLSQTELLTSKQIDLYNRLRGYGKQTHNSQHSGHSH